MLITAYHICTGDTGAGYLSLKCIQTEHINSGAPAELGPAAVQLCVAVHDVPDLVGHVQPA